MIERIVLFKLTDEHTGEAECREIASHSKEVLSKLPGVKAVSVGLPADESSKKSWDLSVVLQFESMEAVQAYVIDPGHREYVDQYMKPRMEVVKAWNFQVS